MRRYPLADLLEAAGMTLSEFRQVQPMSGSTYRNALDLGLTEDQADRWATKVGRHPAEVWPGWMDDQIRGCERDCEECATPFIPKRKDARFCSFTCRRRPIERAKKRRQRQADPAADRARVAAYQSDPRVQEIRRIKARARYRARKESAA